MPTVPTSQPSLEPTGQGSGPIDPTFLIAATAELHEAGRLLEPQERFSDFRRSENVEDRRGESGSIKDRLKNIFLGSDVNYGALTPQEFTSRMNKYSSEELTKIYKSGGPNEIAKQLGFNDLKAK